MRKLRILFVALCSLFFFQQTATAEQAQREIKSSEIKALKRLIEDKYSRMGFPYNLITRVSGKMTHGNINGILACWYSIAAESRARIIEIFRAYELDDFIFLFMYESGGRTNLLNSNGARGLFQIMPATAKEHCGIDTDQLDILFDPETNAACAVKILVDKDATENWRVGAVRYNGQFLRCKIRGYFKCVHELSKSANAKVAASANSSLLYFLNFLMYKEVGKAFIL